MNSFFLYLFLQFFFFLRSIVSFSLLLFVSSESKKYLKVKIKWNDGRKPPKYLPLLFWGLSRTLAIKIESMTVLFQNITSRDNKGYRRIKVTPWKILYMELLCNQNDAEKQLQWSRKSKEYIKNRKRFTSNSFEYSTGSFNLTHIEEGTIASYSVWQKYKFRPGKWSRA